MSEPRKSYVTVVPRERTGTGPVLTQGTKLVLDDGTELQGVSGIVLRAEIGGIWTAEVTLHPRVGVMPGMLATIIQEKTSWWRRMFARLAGVTIDTTCLPSDVRSYRKP